MNRMWVVVENRPKVWLLGEPVETAIGQVTRGVAKVYQARGAWAWEAGGRTGLASSSHAAMIQAECALEKVPQPA